MLQDLIYIELTLEEVDGLVGDEVARQVLRGVDTAHDEGTVEVGALEELSQVGLLDRLLEVDGTAHHGDGLAGVQSRLAAQARNRLRSLFEATLPDQPPG